MNLELAERKIMDGGPSRVVISNDGEATTFTRAYRDYGVEPDIIFIREDGWSLGSPSCFESVAYEMWKDEWVGFMRKPSLIASPIKDYGGDAIAKGV